MNIFSHWWNEGKKEQRRKQKILEESVEIVNIYAETRFMISLGGD